MWTGLKGGLVAVGSALAASVCCLLPLALVLLGVSSGAFMLTTMQYRWLLLPIGVVGLAAGYALHLRERCRCEGLGCRVAAGRTTLVLLVLATLIVLGELAVTLYPEPVARLLARGDGNASHAPHSGGHSSHDSP